MLIKDFISSVSSVQVCVLCFCIMKHLLVPCYCYAAKICLAVDHQRSIADLCLECAPSS